MPILSLLPIPCVSEKLEWANSCMFNLIIWAFLFRCKTFQAASSEVRVWFWWRVTCCHQMMLSHARLTESVFQLVTFPQRNDLFVVENMVTDNRPTRSYCFDKEGFLSFCWILSSNYKLEAWFKVGELYDRQHSSMTMTTTTELSPCKQLLLCLWMKCDVCWEHLWCEVKH